MKYTTETIWQGNMQFETAIGNHKIVMDAGKEFGGEDNGPSPKSLVPAALAGCTGMDVVVILKKMRVDIEGLRIQVESVIQEEHPKRYTSMTVHYYFKGKNLDESKLRKAVEMSEKTYCGVSATLSAGVALSFEIHIEE
ncbi:MAG: OsmC family protein [Bacteroidales bacterium]|nr:OsmC family protein [Bacteroidales bacterium]MDD3166978.1 OsmC family protein [Bacteroidales bacterium]MDD4769967.1 OsmC family protein [Bacteroidales bacterium]